MKLFWRYSFSLFFFIPVFLYGSPFLTVKQTTMDPGVNIPVYEIYGYPWISVSDFMMEIGEDPFYDTSHGVITGKLESYMITIRGGSAFIPIDVYMYHLPGPVERYKNDLVMPLSEWIRFLHTEVFPNLYFNSQSNLLILDPGAYSIQDIKLQNYKNGSTLRIETSRLFKEEDINIWEGRNGWLYCTIYGATGDTLQLSKSYSSGILRHIIPIQMGETFQLSFQLRNLISDYDFYIDPDTRDIVINLRKPTTLSADEKISKESEKWLINTIVLDAGHGGRDPGARGANGVKEKDITLDIVLRLGRLLERDLGMNVVYTRKTDVFIPLHQRTQIANNANGKIFISVHCNSHENRRINGSETFILAPRLTEEAIKIAERENQVIRLEENQKIYEQITNEQYILASMAQSTFMKESEELAALVEKNYTKKLKTTSRGVKQAGFYVLLGASMPNILTEVGFISNKSDLEKLNRASYRQQIAESLFLAIKEFKDKYEKDIPIN
ncbi:MAG: N-acetylmuramoyl-L-alanine amidase [Candidatus Marinimicrobia bacterium]|nr:N-acetylmuramoyl-L-alanine amidase [Candidatus Neomarinimicrobiota bacterium]MDD5582023.1 N-acetylmuramoyl-L-alanine amidase [Candidatus Neomarinimicrobiota bacterium]